MSFFEDNELNAEISCCAVGRVQDKCRKSCGWKECCVKFFQNHPEGTFDVILMDIMMPEMNGYEALKKAIRAMNDRPDGKNIPIIAMTANSFCRRCFRHHWMQE